MILRRVRSRQARAAQTALFRPLDIMSQAVRATHHRRPPGFIRPIPVAEFPRRTYVHEGVRWGREEGRCHSQGLWRWWPSSVLSGLAASWRYPCEIDVHLRRLAAARSGWETTTIELGTGIPATGFAADSLPHGAPDSARPRRSGCLWTHASRMIAWDGRAPLRPAADLQPLSPCLRARLPRPWLGGLALSGVRGAPWAAGRVQLTKGTASLA